METRDAGGGGDCHMYSVASVTNTKMHLPGNIKKLVLSNCNYRCPTLSACLTAGPIFMMLHQLEVNEVMQMLSRCHAFLPFWFSVCHLHHIPLSGITCTVHPTPHLNTRVFIWTIPPLPTAVHLLSSKALVSSWRHLHLYHLHFTSVITLCPGGGGSGTLKLQHTPQALEPILHHWHSKGTMCPIK